jgi:glutathione S-transferase
MTKPILTYFPARGRAEPIRIALAEAGVDYDERAVTKNNFAELKASGTLPFDAVPVWDEPDGFRLAQTMAILSYLGRTHGLHGQTPREQALVDQILLAVDLDIRPELQKIRGVEGEKRTALREEIAQVFMPRWFGYIDRLMGDKPFVAGDRVTIADLLLWYAVETLRDNKLDAGLTRLPRILAHFEKISSRPNIAAWVKSPRRAAAQLLPA